MPEERAAEGATAGPARLTMLTFAPMIDSELCRFLLWRYAVPYIEQRHIFGWASVLSLFRAFTLQVPALYGPGLSGLPGPKAVADHFEKICPPELSLMPPGERTRIDADWKRFNTDLGSETASVSYYYLLPHEDILLEPFGEGLPPGEARVLKPVYPALRWFLGICLGLGATSTKRSLDSIRKTFDAVDARLAGGGPFLVGDSLTLSDLAFATSAAPFLMPEGYTTPMPPLASMPAEMQAIIAETRARPLAGFVQRIYGIRAAG